MAPESRATLEAWVRDPTTPPRLVWRAKICLLAAEGIANQAIATRLGVSRPTVLEWRQRFAKAGSAGIAKDAPRGPSSKRLPDETICSIIDATLKTKPPGATHWTTRTLGKKMGVGHATIARIWGAHGLHPHRPDTAQVSLEKQPQKKHSRRIPSESPLGQSPCRLETHDSIKRKILSETIRAAPAPMSGATVPSRVVETYDMLRTRIAALPCGAQLPAVARIRSELKVSQDTVARALTRLETEGWIERKRRKGIFISDPLATGEIAIVMRQVNLTSGASPIYVRMCIMLRQKIHALNPRWACKLHIGLSTVPGPELPSTLDLLNPMVLPRLRGVLTFNPLYEMRAKLQAAGVPVVFFSDPEDSMDTGVGFDVDQMLRDGIRHLAESGCRSVCMLRARSIMEKPFGRDRVPVAAAAAADCGLEFQDEWIGCGNDGWGEQHGYDLFLRMWDQGKRPDGILVDDDILCHGVLRAIQERQVKLPQDLRLVTQASRGFGFPYPRPVTRIEFDLNVGAEKMVSLLETLARGLPLENRCVLIPVNLVKGATT